MRIANVASLEYYSSGRSILKRLRTGDEDDEVLFYVKYINSPNL